MGVEAIVYIFLIVLGASSLQYARLSENGGTAFTQIMSHYTGLIGTAILGAVTLLACLTSCVGLITSLAQDWGHRFPKLGYHFFLGLTSIGAFLIANFGLDQIILYSSPILSFLYPLAIALIVLGLLHPLIGKQKLIYKSTILLTLIPAILDLIHNLPPVFANLAPFKAIDLWASHSIPLFNVGLDFLPFMAIGLGLSWILSKLLHLKPTLALTAKKQSSNNY